jgi:hypothetical protein
LIGDIANHIARALHCRVTRERAVPMLTDVDRCDYLPLIDRPRIRWPGDAFLARWVAPNIEFYELNPPDGRQGRPLWPRPCPDVLNYSLRDYGNRVGVCRMMTALERFKICASVAQRCHVRPILQVRNRQHVKIIDQRAFEKASLTSDQQETSGPAPCE